jgi:ComF family protein
MLFSRLLQSATTLLPSSCRVCQGWADGSVCSACLARFAAPCLRCATCALPLPASAALSFPTAAQRSSGNAAPRCGSCLSFGSPLQACYAAVGYAYPWDGIIRRLKYADGKPLGAQPALAHSMAAVMQHVATQDAALAQGLLQASRCDWLIPVPLHPERQLERGFNQALVLAQALFPQQRHIRHDLLLRIKNTATQADLERDERIANLHGAFAAEPLRISELAGSRVMLLDDVCTTTATLGAAALALRRAGVQEVQALVFARTA